MSDSVPERPKIVRMPTAASVFGPFRFDQRNGRLSRGDAQVHLTPRASGVLRCLLDRRDEIVSKDALFDEVWKGVSVTDDALLQVVSVLRKALGDDPRRPDYIQTVTGEGYRFIGEVRDEPLPSALSAPVPVTSQSGAAEARGTALREVAPAAGKIGSAALEDTATPDAVAPAHPASMWRRVAIGMVLGAAVAVAWGLWSGALDLTPRGAGGVADRTSIAVLPFDNMSDDPADEYLSDGLAEELLIRLGRVEGLRVVARTSSFALKAQGLAIIEIGRRLNVGTILEGSTRRDGTRVRIVARLVDAKDGLEIWSNTYDFRYGDVFTVQEEIARRVVEALTIPLLGDDVALLARTPTNSPEAYERYLRGRFLLARYTADAYPAAARYFEDAIEIDPNFALAYVGLADAYLMQNRYGVLPRDEALAVAGPAVDRAMQIDSGLGEAYAMMGLARQLQGDIDGARAAYERAIELDPDAARAYQLYWWMMFVREGNTAKTLALAEKALAADPYSPAQNENYGWTLFEAGNFDDALVYFQKSIELEPAYPFGYNGVGAYHQAMGETDEAIESFVRASARSPETSTFRMNLSHAYATVGRADEAIAQLEAAISNNPAAGGLYRAVGEVYWEVLGRPDHAVAWYEDAIERNPDVERLRVSLALVCLDLNDEACARRWVESAEAMDADNRWAQIGRLNLYMHGGDFAEGANLARQLARSARYLGHLNQYNRPYAEFAPLGYFSLLAGRPSDALIFPTRAYSELMEDDPAINAFNVNAAIDLAATLQRTGEADRADLLLRRSMEFIDSQQPGARRSRYREEPVEIYALLGMVPEALAALRSAIDLGWRRGWWRARDKPHYESLRGEPEFQAMLAQLEAEAETMRRGLAAEPIG